MTQSHFNRVQQIHPLQSGGFVRFGLLALFALVMFAALPSCKAKKQAQADKAAAELLVQQTDQAKKDLISLLSDNNGMSIAEKEEALNAIKELGLQDAEVLDLISQVEAKIAAEKTAMLEAEKRVEEEAAKQRARIELEARQRAINTAIANVARSGSQADINAVLDLFSGKDVPVLIVIAESAGIKDYDRPTTILRYLEHVKDTRSVEEKVSQLTYDDYGKIVEVEMVKN